MSALSAIGPVMVVTRPQPALDGFARLAEGMEGEATAARGFMDEPLAGHGLIDLPLIDRLPASRLHYSDLSETDRSGLICYVSFGPSL